MYKRITHLIYFVSAALGLLVTMLCMFAGCRATRAVPQVQYQQDSIFTSGNGVMPEVDSNVFIQEQVVSASIAQPDTLAYADITHGHDTLFAVNIDSAFVEEMHALLSDSLSQDTLSTFSMSNRSLGTKQPKDPAFTTKILRNSIDSVIMDIKNNTVYYYGKAVVKYDDIVLEAEFLEFNMNTSVCTARGLSDSTGRLYGTPVFTQGDTKFEAEEMAYNFKTKKGVITKVFTEEGGGYLHGTKIKRMDDNTINIKSGGFTTCNLKEHPHFQFRFKKAKVIPDDKIVTGPIFLTIEDVPLPLGLPFALIPNVKGQRSGVIIPTYGESANRGFYLENGGYYWAINEHYDLQVLGDIYTRGSWAIKPMFRYAQRYRYNGSLALGFAVNKIGSKGAADYNESNDFKVKWTHKQDPKAHPRHTFSADVNILSSNYNQYNAISSNEYLSNTFKSSVAYQTNFAGRFYLTLNAGHSQNTLTKQVTISLPELTFTANRFYPLKKVGKPGKRRWYKELNISYTMNAKNYMSNVDTLLFRGNWVRNMQNGIRHSIPINLPVKLLKHFTWTNSVNINDYMYFDHLEQQWVNEMQIHGGDTVQGYLKTDTVYGFRNLVDFNLSSSLTTKLYGMVRFQKGPIRAVRHVLTPMVSFTYKPDFAHPRWGVYGRYADANGVEKVYNKFSRALFGAPSMNRSGRLNYSLGNTFDMKVPSKTDTITGMKNVTLLESLSLAGSYDFAQDSLNFSNVSVNARTTLFQKLRVQYSSIWDPYIADSTGRRINRYEIVENRRLFHKNSSTWNFSMSWSFSQSDLQKLLKNKSKTTFENDIANRARQSANVTEQELSDVMGNPNAYVDWNTPWSLTFSYNLSHTTSIVYARLMGIATNSVVQTLSLNGDISITPKWKITFTTGWDFTNHGLSYTSVNIYRDLHCWEMRFSWVPIGNYKSWNFTINVKASALQDLKLTKKKDYRDN